MKILKISFIFIILSHLIIPSDVPNSSQIKLIKENPYNNEPAIALTPCTLAAMTTGYTIRNKERSNLTAIKPEFIVQELDYENEFEKTQIIEIFQDNEVQIGTCCTPDRITCIMNNMNHIPNQASILTCKEIESKLIQGILIFRLESNQNHYQTYISVIATHKNFRRKNIASLLLSHVEKIARDNESDKIYLHVCPSNYNAMHFYENYGLSMTDYDGNYTIMSKNLIS